jgi:hypothetical protein
MHINNCAVKLFNYYDKFKLSNYRHKLFTYDNLIHLINRYKYIFNIDVIGKSIEDKNIYEISLHQNKYNNNIMIFSQMHGDETTGTYSIFDVLNFFSQKSDLSLFLMKKFNFYFIPMLNPDGAEKFIRYNAIGVDINRDAKYRCSPEINTILNRIYHYNPIMIFNLHDKRRIFNIKNTNQPSIISFLSPSEDITKKITYTRKITMGLIALIYKELYKLIPNNIGRFSDDFYPNAIGDNLHIENFPCTLIEAGYCNNDDNKILTRKYNTISLLLAFYQLSITKELASYHKYYFNIPENDNKMIDELYSNVTIEKNKQKFIVNLDVKIIEFIKKGTLYTDKIINQIGILNEFYPRVVFNMYYKKIIHISQNINHPIIGASIKNFIFE